MEGRSSLYSYSFAASCDLYLKVQKGVASPCALRMSDFRRRLKLHPPARPTPGRSSLYSYSFAASCDLYLKVQKGVASP